MKKKTGGTDWRKDHWRRMWCERSGVVDDGHVWLLGKRVGSCDIGIYGAEPPLKGIAVVPDKLVGCESMACCLSSMAYVKVNGGSTFGWDIVDGATPLADVEVLVSLANVDGFEIDSAPILRTIVAFQHPKPFGGKCCLPKVENAPNLKTVYCLVSDKLELETYKKALEEEEERKSPDVEYRVVTLDGLPGDLQDAVKSHMSSAPAVMEMKVSKLGRVAVIKKRAYKGRENLQAVELGEMVTKIEEEAFYHSSVASIKFPVGLERIDQHAFCGTLLVSVEVPASVSFLGSGVFSDCANLQDIVFPEGLEDLPFAICYGCSSLTSVKLPESLRTIGMRAFYGCKSLKSIVLPPKLKHIEQEAFEGCVALENIVIPKGCELDDDVFKGCTSLGL